VTDRAAVPTGIGRIGVVGYNHRLLPASQRGLLAFDEPWCDHLCAELRRSGLADGVAFVGTCNRQEIVVSASHPGFALELLRSQLQVKLAGEHAAGPPPPPEPYRFVGEDAVRHVLRVASSLDSLVVGEREITQQVRRSFDLARRRGWLDKPLNGLASIAVGTAKEIHRSTDLSRDPTGVFSLAAEVVRTQTAELARPRVAVVGLGEIGLKTARELAGESRLDLVIASRTQRSARQLGTLLQGRPFVPLERIGELLSSCDAVVAATGAPVPIVRESAVRAARAGASRPLVLVDIGIPPQVEAVPEPFAKLFNLDWFTQTGFGQRPRRLAALQAARDIVEQGVRRTAEWTSLRRYSALFDACDALAARFREERVPALLRTELATLSADDQRLVRDRMLALLTDYADQLFETLNRELPHAERAEPESAEPALRARNAG